jgi:hypothetical protein
MCSRVYLDFVASLTEPEGISHMVVFKMPCIVNRFSKMGHLLPYGQSSLVDVTFTASFSHDSQKMKTTFPELPCDIESSSLKLILATLSPLSNRHSTLILCPDIGVPLQHRIDPWELPSCY